MAEGRTYKEVVASLETHIIYINNHLSNIDGHLEKLNTRTHDNEIQIAVNKTGISRIYKIGGGILGLAALIAAITLGVMNLL